jgi:hypothetical protein
MVPNSIGGTSSAIAVIQGRMCDDGTFMPFDIEFQFDVGYAGDGAVVLGWIDAFAIRSPSPFLNSMRRNHERCKIPLRRLSPCPFAETKKIEKTAHRKNGAPCEKWSRKSTL